MPRIRANVMFRCRSRTLPARNGNCKISSARPVTIGTATTFEVAGYIWIWLPGRLPSIPSQARLIAVGSLRRYLPHQGDVQANRVWITPALNDFGGFDGHGADWIGR